MWNIEKSFHPLAISKVFEETMHIYIHIWIFFVKSVTFLQSKSSFSQQVD